MAVNTTEVYRAWDEGARAVAESGDEAGNALEGAAVAVVPRLAAWRDRLAQVCGQRPRLAGSGSTWFVEGSPEVLGLDDLAFLDLDGERAPLRTVRTLPPEPEVRG
jgi:4-diphosphocytidyl-2-C-methyl-D-erythritol kinase